MKKASIWPKILKWIGAVLTAFFVLCIALNAVLIGATILNPTEMPGVFGYKPVICLSGSMEPAFSSGELIVLKTVSDEALVVGDVICYRYEGTAITHRIVDTEEYDGQTIYVTQGDANNVADNVLVFRDMIEGRYTGVHLPHLGRVALFMQSPAGMVLFVGCPLVLMLGYDIVIKCLKERKEAAKSDKEKEESFN